MTLLERILDRVRALEPFKSRAQQGMAFATKQPWAKRWGDLTKKQKGGFKKVPKYAPGSKSPNKHRARGHKIPVSSPAYKRAMKAAASYVEAVREKTNQPGDTITADFRQKYGIKGKDGAYHLPLPPDGHPMAKQFAAAVLKRAPQVTQLSAEQVAKQVARAKKILGQSNEAGAEQTDPKMVAAIEALRERGVVDPHAVPFHLDIELREGATAKFNEDGSIRSLVIREGPGNPRDKNYYTRSFVESLLPLLEGADAFYDHPSESEERDRQERGIRDKAGWWAEPTVESFTDEHKRAVAGGWAQFHPRAGDPVIESLIRTTREKAQKYPTKAPFMAFSINGYGAGAAGKSPLDESDCNLVETATQLRSVDVVTYGGAGGRPTFSQ